MQEHFQGFHGWQKLDSDLFYQKFSVELAARGLCRLARVDRGMSPMSSCASAYFGKRTNVFASISARFGGVGGEWLKIHSEWSI